MQGQVNPPIPLRAGLSLAGPHSLLQMENVKTWPLSPTPIATGLGERWEELWSGVTAMFWDGWAWGCCRRGGETAGACESGMRVTGRTWSWSVRGHQVWVGCNQLVWLILMKIYFSILVSVFFPSPCSGGHSPPLPSLGMEQLAGGAGALHAHQIPYPGPTSAAGTPGQTHCPQPGPGFQGLPEETGALVVSGFLLPASWLQPWTPNHW